MQFDDAVIKIGHCYGVVASNIEAFAAVLDSEGLKTVVEDATDLTASVPAWLQADHDNMVGKVLRLPERTDIDIPVQESLIVELYSK